MCGRVSAKDFDAFVYDLAFGYLDFSGKVCRRSRLKLVDLSVSINDCHSRGKRKRCRRTDLSDEGESALSVDELNVDETTDIHRTCCNVLNSSTKGSDGC